MSIKTLTEILNLSLELKDYEERVQKRYDYIQEQLEKDPNWVGYDYLEYWHGRADIHYFLHKSVISTNGEIYKLVGEEWSKAAHNRMELYLTKSFNLSGKTKNFQIHRCVATTFIPKYEHLKDVPYWKLEVNHKDGDKHNPKISNLEWMTKSENTQHALDNGLQKSGKSCEQSKLYLATVTADCKYKGEKFTVSGNLNFKNIGFSKASIVRYVSGKRYVAYGCHWEEITKEEGLKYQDTPPDGFLEFIFSNRNTYLPGMLTLLVTIMDGEFKGYRFVLSGAKELKAHGFNQGLVSRSMRLNHIHKSCKFEKISISESLNYPRGCSKDIISKLPK